MNAYISSSVRVRGVCYFALFMGLVVGTARGSDADPSNDLTDRIWTGYQGWFQTGSDTMAQKWFHWTEDDGVNNGTDDWGVDSFPGGMGLYADKYLNELGYKTGENKNAYVFSSMDKSTTDLHINWMEDYGLHGLFLQWQIFNTSPDAMDAKCNVAAHINEELETRNGSVKYAIMFANNIKDKFDSNDEPTIPNGVSPYNNLVAHEQRWRFGKNWQRKDHYAHHNGKPIAALWGIGHDNRDDSCPVSEAMRMVTYLKNRGYYVVLGVPDNWKSKVGWDVVWSRADAIQPWRNHFKYPSTSQLNTVTLDQAWCDLNNIVYMSCITPGASTYYQHNLDEASFNWKPRRRGAFLWEQFVQAMNIQTDKSATNAALYIAMFDEVDEGTAMFRLVAKEEKLPSKPPATINSVFHMTYVEIDDTAGQTPRPEMHYLNLAKDLEAIRASLTGNEQLDVDGIRKPARIN